MRQEHSKHQKRYEAVHLNAPDKELEAKIDAMLDPNLPDEPAEPPVVRISDTPQVVADTPPLDIFKDNKPPAELTSVPDGDGASGDIGSDSDTGQDASPQPDKPEQKTPKPRPKKTSTGKRKEPKSRPPEKSSQNADAPPPAPPEKVHHNKFGLYAAAVAAILIMVAISIVVWPDSREYLFEILDI